MSSNKTYSTEFKKTIVNLYHSGKSYSQIHTEYGVSTSALSKWVKLYSEVKIDDDTVITAQQIKELQKRNAQLEEENLILKKPLQYSLHTQTKTDCRQSALRSAPYLYPLQSTEGQQKYLLQMDTTFSFSQRDRAQSHSFLYP